MFIKNKKKNDAEEYLNYLLEKINTSDPKKYALREYMGAENVLRKLGFICYEADGKVTISKVS